METLDDTNFDVIIVGTGLTEAILSGAIARIGKKVLHLDKNEYYGSYTTSFALSALNDLLNNPNNKSFAELKTELGDSLLGQSIALPLHLFNCETEFINRVSSSKEEQLKDAQPQESGKEVPPENNQGESISEEPTKESEKTEPPKVELSAEEEMMKESRHYSIDISPRLQFSSGTEVELLISSGVARYLEFKPMESVYLYTNKDFQQVPCSKGNVFKNKFISLIEKRYLSKFITFIRNELEGTKSEEEESEDIPKTGNFIDFLKAHSLTPKLISFVLYSICFLNTEQSSEEIAKITAEEGIQLIKRFVGSIGRYGSTPFIGSLYGLNEFSQAYSRLSAVYGGVFMLRKSIEKVTTVDKKITGIVDSDGQTFSCENLVLNIEFAPKFVDEDKSRLVSRCVCVVDRSMREGEKQFVAVIPPNTFGNKYSIQVLQYSHEMYVCPKGKFLVHFTTIGSDTAKKDLISCCENLLNFSNESTTQPSVFYYAFFNLMERVPKEDDTLPTGVYLSGDLDADIDSSKSVREARKIFKGIFPNEEFLPKAHEEEDLVWEEVPEQKEQMPNNPAPDQSSSDV